MHLAKSFAPPLASSRLSSELFYKIKLEEESLPRLRQTGESSSSSLTNAHLAPPPFNKVKLTRQTVASDFLEGLAETDPGKT